MKWILFLSLGFISFAAQTRAQCPSSPLAVRALLPLLRQNLTQREVWPGFRLAHEAMTLIDLGQNTCAYLIKNAQVQKTQILSQAWNKGTFGFDFLPSRSRYPRYPGQSLSRFNSIELDQVIDEQGVFRCCELIRPIQSALNSLLDEAHEPYALVYWMSGTQGGLGFNIATMTHEAFHFFYQNRGLGSASWPKLRFSSVDKLQSCYIGTPERLALFRKEISSLLEAETLRLERGDERAAIRRFIEWRRARYQAGRSVGNCKQMESVRESVEGTAHFVGIKTMRQLGFMSDPEYLQYLRNNLNPERPSVIYYFIGMIELNLLESLSGADFFNEARRISQAPEPLSYFELLDLRL